MIRNITLINPPIAPEAMYGKLAPAGSTEPNLGLCSLAAYVRQRGFGVRIIDAHILRLGPEEVIGEMETAPPDLTGITSVTLGMENAAALAGRIRERFPAIPIHLGGVHVTAVPEETLARYPVFDMGILGEGEITFVELIDAINRGKDLAEVRGIIYRRDGELVRTQPRPFVRNLDDLPMPAFDLLPELTKHYHTPATACNNSPSCSIVTTRGCGAKCTFCFQGAMGRACRGYSAGRIIEMILLLHRRYGIKDIRIMDDNFVANRRRLVQVCEALIGLKLDFSWSCYARVDVVDAPTLALMKKAGCWQISYGIESGCQEILDLVKKGITVERAREAVHLTHQAGIKSLGFFIIGFPGETRDTIARTIHFARSIELDDFKMNFLAPYPGTELAETAQRYGTVSREWSRLNMYYEPPFIPFGLTREELIAAKKRAFFEFYVRPRIILAYILGIRNISHVKKLLTGFTSLLKYWILPEKKAA